MGVVIPVLNESGGLLARTLESLMRQTRRPTQTLVIDDGSLEPLQLPRHLRNDVGLLRLPTNHGGATARNHGARALPKTEYVLFLNCDVVLNPRWLEDAVAFMQSNERVAAIGGRIAPVVGPRLLREWRLQFIETKVHRAAIAAPTDVTWLVGHAIFTRRDVYEQLDGFDEKYSCAGEDWDYCQRVIEAGYCVSHVPSLVAESHEVASIDRLARKSVRNSGWDIRTNYAAHTCAAVQPVRLGAAVTSTLRLLVMRCGRDIVKRRFSLVVVDVAVAARSLVLLWRARQRSRRYWPRAVSG